MKVAPSVKDGATFLFSYKKATEAGCVPASVRLRIVELGLRIVD